MATVHVAPTPGTDPLALPTQLAGYLRREHAIGHATVQVDAPGHIEAPAH